ncbi:MAG: HIT domain-containing protein [Candidatus Babeliales bacterium]
MAECIFCKVIEGKVPSIKVAESDSILVIKDIAPKAAVHYLIIPKKHISDVRAFEQENAGIAADMIMMAQKLSQNLSEPKAFRLIINNGAEAGQCVFHVHMHFLAGKKLPGF